MPKPRQHKAAAVSEQQMLGWLWRGLKLKGHPPTSLPALAEVHYDQMDEVRPLPISWSRVYIACAAFPVCRDIWMSNEDSALHELLSQTPAGILLVADSTVVASHQCLHLVYSDSADIDALQFDADTPPTLVHPGWAVSCEKLCRK